MRRPAVLLALAAAVVSVAPSHGYAKKGSGPPTVTFLAPADGPDAAAATEVLFGIRPAISARLPGSEDEPDAFALAKGDLPVDGDLKSAFAKLKKGGTRLLVVYLPHGRTTAVTAAAVKAKLPLLVTSPEATMRSLDPKREVFWAGGVAPQDEALQGMDYMMQPLASMQPLIVHDGSPRGVDVTAACSFFRHAAQTPRGPVEVSSLDGPALAQHISDGADGLLYFGGPAGAEALLALQADAAAELPVLLGQGSASAAVPSFHSGSAKTAWSMETRFFDDRGNGGRDERYPLVDALAAAELSVRANHERGHRIGLWLRAAFEAADGDMKQFVPSLRDVNRPGAAGKRVFEPWGWACLARLELWHSAPIEIEKMGACHRRPETRVPVQSIPHVGFFSASRFKWEPGTTHVWVHWREGESRTIETDMFKIGLNTKGYEENLEERILDDLLGRMISRLHRLFLRNPDGTAIPGVSFNVSFSTEPPPDAASGRKLEVIIGGDDPAAGGRAFGNTALVFSTFLERTMYSKYKLAKPVSAADRPHMAGGYKWDTSAEENIRNGEVRSLVDGFSQGMALTGAHELGHLCGNGHDQETPRSIMNVVDGGGLDFEWAEWTPRCAKNVEKTLKRVSAAKR